MKARPEHSKEAHKGQCEIITAVSHSWKAVGKRARAGSCARKPQLNPTAKLNSTDSILQNYHEAFQAESMYTIIIFSWLKWYRTFSCCKWHFTRLPLFEAVALSTVGSLAAQMGVSFSFPCWCGGKQKTAAWLVRAHRFKTKFPSHLLLLWFPKPDCVAVCLAGSCSNIGCKSIFHSLDMWFIFPCKHCGPGPAPTQSFINQCSHY